LYSLRKPRPPQLSVACPHAAFSSCSPSSTGTFSGICFLVLGLWMVAEQRWSYARHPLRARYVCETVSRSSTYRSSWLRLLRRESAPGHFRRLGGLPACNLCRVNLPFCITAYHNWTFFFAFNASRSAGRYSWGAFGNHVALRIRDRGCCRCFTRRRYPRGVARWKCRESSGLYVRSVSLGPTRCISQYTLWLFVMHWSPSGRDGRSCFVCGRAS